MKITKRQLKRIIKEELIKESGGDPLQLLEKIANELIEDGKDMENWPSHTPASHVASWVARKGQEVKQALDMFDAEAGRNPGGSIGENVNAEQAMLQDNSKIQQAIYDLEDRVMPVLYGTELEQMANELHKAMYKKVAGK